SCSPLVLFVSLLFRSYVPLASFLFFFSMLPRSPISTLFPYTTLFRSPVYFPGQLLPEYVAYEFPLHSVHMSLSYVFFLNLIFLSSVYVSSPLEARQYDPYLGG